MRRLAALALVLCGCLRADLVSCPNGLVCSADQVCDLVHDRCVAPERITACADLGDGAICNAEGDVGECLDGVCLDTVCGDGLLAASEVCDDGNAIDGDGCDARCASTELCGNGIVDVAQGEACDDENELSGDGCDPLCRGEQEIWTTIGLALQYDAPGSAHTAYDATRKQAIHPVDGLTWTWNGTAWSVLTDRGPPPVSSPQWYQVMAVPDRDSVVYVATNPSGDVDQVWEWNGSAWTRLAIHGAVPHLSAAHAVYDRGNRVVLVMGWDGAAVRMWAFDLATATWTKQADIGVGYYSYGAAMAYDEQRGVTVLVFGSQTSDTPDTYEWNGTVWTPFVDQPMPATRGFSLVYDPLEEAVIALGNSSVMATWTGSAWQTLPDVVPANSTFPDAWFDDDRQLRVLFDSTHRVFDWTGSSSTTFVPPQHEAQFVGFFGLRYAYDPYTHDLIQFGVGQYGGTTAGIDTWAYRDGTWRELPLAPINGRMYGAAAIAFDPIRRATVAVFQDRSTWLLRDDLWTQLQPPGAAPVAGFETMGYDPSRSAMIGLGGGLAYMLPSTGTAWSQLPGVPGVSSGSLAYDARANQLVMVTFGSAVLFYDGVSWTSSLSAGTGFTVTANDRRGTIDLVSGQRNGWEHVDPAWREASRPPVAVTGITVAAPERAELLLIGIAGHSRVLLRRSYVGAAPLETCTGADEDTDGEVDCADPDCWWSCAAACPPYASCP